MRPSMYTCACVSLCVSRTATLRLITRCCPCRSSVNTEEPGVCSLVCLYRLSLLMRSDRPPYWSLTASHWLGLFGSDGSWGFNTLKSFVDLNIHTVLDHDLSLPLSDILNQTHTTSSVPAARRRSTAAQRSRSAREKENKSSLSASESNGSCQVGFSTANLHWRVWRSSVLIFM